MKYPVFTPIITESDIEFTKQCLQDGWVSSNGPYVRNFEDSFASYIGSKYATCVSNGTSALEVALAGLEITEGEVILPAFTIASCAYAILRVGCKPVFVDIDKDYYCLNPVSVEKSISSQTKAIMLVNMYGNTVDVDSFLELKNKYNIPIIEDCSENLGGSYKHHKSGSQFDVSTFSLYANKTITSGEGGVVCTSDPCIYEKCLRYKNLDFPADRSFTHSNQAYNFRMAAPLAALAHSQLKRIDDILQIKDSIFKYYLSHICTEKLIPLIPRPDSRFVPWMNCFRVSKTFPFYYQDFESYMAMAGIQVRPFFSNLAKQIFFSRYARDCDKFPITDLVALSGFYLPSGLNLELSDIIFISDRVNSYFS
jgi:perosamine synthetase